MKVGLKNSIPALLDGENFMILWSLVLMHYQTDGHTAYLWLSYAVAETSNDDNTKFSLKGQKK